MKVDLHKDGPESKTVEVILTAGAQCVSPGYLNEEFIV